MFEHTVTLPLLSASLIFLFVGLTNLLSFNEIPIYDIVPFGESHLQNLIYYLSTPLSLALISVISYLVLVYKKLRKRKPDYVMALSTSFGTVSLLLTSHLINGMMFFYGLTNPVYENGIINYDAIQMIATILLYNIIVRDFALNFEGNGGLTGFMRKMMVKHLKKYFTLTQFNKSKTKN